MRTAIRRLTGIKMKTANIPVFKREAVSIPLYMAEPVLTDPSRTRIADPAVHWQTPWIPMPVMA